MKSAFVARLGKQVAGEVWLGLRTCRELARSADMSSCRAHPRAGGNRTPVGLGLLGFLKGAPRSYFREQTLGLLQGILRIVSGGEDV